MNTSNTQSTVSKICFIEFHGPFADLEEMLPVRSLSMRKLPYIPENLYEKKFSLPKTILFL
jgi:hypothetical protein